MTSTRQHLQEQLQQREAEIALLKEITHVIGTEYNLQKVFDLVAHHALKLIEAETITIPVMSDDRRSYTYKAAAGKNAEELSGAELPIEIGVCGWVLRHQQAWWQGALNQLEENERNQWENKAGTIILVPLQGKRQFLGGIAGINKNGGADFSNRDLDLLTMFASQVSIAIENAMYVEQLDAERKHTEDYKLKLEESNEKLSRTNKELQQLAIHDPLTGLPNRTLILDRLQQSLLIAKRAKQTTALLMIDLDHFKEVNDSLGHTVGDELLLRLGKQFNAVLREQDTLGRLGGDEYAIVLPGADLSAAIQVSGKIQHALDTPIEISQYSLSVSASIGIALYPDHGTDPINLLKSADIAMYSSKRKNDDYAIYSPQQDPGSKDSLDLIRDLRISVQEKKIEIAFQPKIDLAHNTLIGVEALARWKHPVHGQVPPSKFIPLLEKTGVIRPFTLQILEKSIQLCSEHLEHDSNRSISLAINLSMHNLRDDQLPAQIEDILHRYRFNKKSLVLEITESAIMQDPEHSLAILQKLDAMGICLSIDDFGTGYSSLTYLKRLPVQQLKIDRSFIKNMTHDKDDAMIVHSTIDLAHNLGLSIVAEGVETVETLQALQRLNCDFVQGYLIARPMTAEALKTFTQSSPWPTQKLPLSAKH